MLQLLKTNQKHYFCAIHPSEGCYFLSAVHIEKQQIFFDDCAAGTLAQLAEKFTVYQLALGVSDEYLTRHTDYVSKEDDVFKYYQKNDRSNYSDIASVESSDASVEQLIVHYTLSNDDFLKKYNEAGFVLSALEPLDTVHKRALTKSWQQEALVFFAQHHPDVHQSAAEITLKLLDRENFYGYCCT